MTKYQKQFNSYVREMANIMGLKDWNVTISSKFADEGDGASIDLTYGQKYAQINLSKKFGEKSRQMQREYLCHELLHCHLEAPWQLAIDTMTQKERTMFETIFEYAVDAIAVSWSTKLPLPPLLVKEKK